MRLKKIKEAYHTLIFRLPLEAIVWILGLILLATYDPFQQDHMTVCFFNNLGLKFCPGCGLGRSVSFLLHGHLIKSLEAHPLGLPAVLILIFRIFQLLSEYFKRLKLKYKYHGKRT